MGNTELFSVNETGFRKHGEHELGFASKSKTPVIRLNANSHSVNMNSAIWQNNFYPYFQFNDPFQIF